MAYGLGLTRYGTASHDDNHPVHSQYLDCVLLSGSWRAPTRELTDFAWPGGRDHSNAPLGSVQKEIRSGIELLQVN